MMRTKLFFLLILCALIFSCKNDDDQIILPGNEQIALSSTNYTYEGDLYRYALNIETENLNEQIEYWESLDDGDPGYEDAETNIEEANVRIDEITTILTDLPEGIQIGFPPIPPPPPPPICFCFTDIYQSLDFIVLNIDSEILNATITNENQEEVFVANFSEPLIIEGFEDGFKAFNFTAIEEGFTGVGYLTITKIVDNETITYGIPVGINEAP